MLWVGSVLLLRGDVDIAGLLALRPRPLGPDGGLLDTMTLLVFLLCLDSVAAAAADTDPAESELAPVPPATFIEFADPELVDPSASPATETSVAAGCRTAELLGSLCPTSGGPCCARFLLSSSALLAYWIDSAASDRALPASPYPPADTFATASARLAALLNQFAASIAFISVCLCSSLFAPRIWSTMSLEFSSCSRRPDISLNS